MGQRDEFITVKVEDAIGIVELNRPDVLNALNRQMVSEVVGAFERLDRDGSVKVILLMGRGRAFAAGADIVLVDNMSTADIREAVRRVRGAARIEISGGVSLERMPELAGTGADFVSVGGLTHSAAAADISFEIEPLPSTP